MPDEVVRAADQIELVDMTPEALRRRMAHGNIYAAGHGSTRRCPTTSGVGNLTALRELALLWLADQVDDALDRYRADHKITATWEARERVVVAVTGGPEGDTLIRRAARIAARTKGADLLAVHVARSDGLAGAEPGQPGPPAAAGREPRRHLPPGRRRRHRRPRCSTSPAASTPPSWSSAPAAADASPARAPAGSALRSPPSPDSIDVHLVTHESGHQGSSSGPARSLD